MTGKAPQKINSIDTLFLEAPPSCIEFWNLHPDYFVLGTYFLKNPEEGQEQGNLREENQSNQDTPLKKPQERTGSLLLCKLNNKKIEIVDTYETNYAILDLHFAYQGNGNERNHTSIFWTANSTGSIAEYEILFSGSNANPTIVQKSIHQLYPKDELVLSFCWHPKDPTLMSTTLSNGDVHVLRNPSKASDGKAIQKQSTQKTASHELEAWTSHFSSQGEDLLFSGGDDAILQYTSTRPNSQGSRDIEEDEQEEPPTPIFLPRKFHNAGITAILALPNSLLLTGSYDDHIRLISTHPRPRILAQRNLDGGVWRLKLLSSNPEISNEEPSTEAEKHSYDILATCMHAGTRIVRLTLSGSDGPKFEVLATFEENESMNYGSDVQPKGEGKERGYTVVSTSFYDRRVCLWRFGGEDGGRDGGGGGSL